MAVSREKESLAKVLVHEGGYVNHPADPGGPTNKGVTQRVYDGYRKGKGLAKRSVKSITMDEVGEIYDRQYWDAVKGDLLPDGVDYVVFDGGVNSGPGRSIMWLQQALRPIYTGPIDGVMGVGTLAALKAVNNNDALIDRICDARMNFLRHLGTFPTFGKGWTARVAEVRAIGKAWATGEKPQAANFIDGGQAKALVEDAKAAPSTAPADLATGGGVAGGGLAGTLTELQNQISPLSYSSELIGKVVVALAFASALLVIGGLAYRWYVNRKAKRLAEALGTAPA
ncbi:MULTISPECIES: glycoside hydrolase family 108 protein [unclassified Mesorhizobium]|uniref:glycoside hydrolase family 108 protein n=1 Tax=unclassified Mesorhizobium TaxID=325217 RepID=UPI00112ADEEE|nr:MULTISPECIES: glycoside hydrolase family 108 protein [unclassified Mesorhizobium]MCA0025459.1 glycoside hydrolase family 108 protein [Mesorhizobium sp. B263B1A]TPJ97151.1 N-acetylmuramidase [Mesorhizobium sp. B2-5-12]TPK27182.1 N-acetylmuramidase [Mesorhizobium sp. B2-5-6]